MLRVASFSITDAAGINALLDKYRLASGAHILVSDGTVCIPYEDGEPDPPMLRIVAVKEQKNTVLRELDLINHSQAVIEFLIKRAQKELGELQANLLEANTRTYVKSAEKKQLEDELTKAQNALDQLISQKKNNQREIDQFNFKLALFEEQISKLGK